MIIRTTRNGGIKVKTVPELWRRMLGMLKGQVRYGLDNVPTSLEWILTHLRYARDPDEFWKTVGEIVRDREDDCEGLTHITCCTLLSLDVFCLPAIARFSPRTLHAVCIVRAEDLTQWTFEQYPLVYPNVDRSKFRVLDVSYLCGMGIPVEKLPGRPPQPSKVVGRKIFYVGNR